MTEYVKVSCVSMFRQTYMIPVDELQQENTEIDILQDPAKQIEWAEDSVSSESVDEFSQKWLGETITESSILTTDQVLDLFDKDYVVLNINKIWDNYLNNKEWNPPAYVYENNLLLLNDEYDMYCDYIKWKKNIHNMNKEINRTKFWKYIIRVIEFRTIEFLLY